MVKFKGCDKMIIYKCLSCGVEQKVEVVCERERCESMFKNQKVIGYKSETYVECKNCGFRELVNPFLPADRIIEIEGGKNE